METLHQYAARLAKEFESADFEAEQNNCLVPPVSAQKKMNGLWASDAILRYVPRARVNANGSRSFGLSFPALAVSTMVGDPMKVAEGLAHTLNHSRTVAAAYVEAVDLLIAALPWVEAQLDDPANKPGTVRAMAAKMRAAIAKAEGAA